MSFFSSSLLSVNAVTPGCKSSDEILVKNAQNLLQTVLRGVHAAETACITVNPNEICDDIISFPLYCRYTVQLKLV